eukprot:scaffold103675_cov70-Phaeocystis_antarctica.AAC.3
MPLDTCALTGVVAPSESLRCSGAEGLRARTGTAASALAPRRRCRIAPSDAHTETAEPSVCRSDAEAQRKASTAQRKPSPGAAPALRRGGAASSSHDALGLDLQLAVEAEQGMSDVDARRSGRRSLSSEGFATTLSSDTARCSSFP